MLKRAANAEAREHARSLIAVANSFGGPNRPSFYIFRLGSTEARLAIRFADWDRVIDHPVQLNVPDDKLNVWERDYRDGLIVYARGMKAADGDRRSEAETQSTLLQAMLWRLSQEELDDNNKVLRQQVLKILGTAALELNGAVTGYKGDLVAARKLLERADQNETDIGYFEPPLYSRPLRNNMHENREISCASWSNDQDRSAKAINRTADVHAQEKSDCAIVPMNRSNEEVQTSEEVGEGRAQTEESIAESHMSPTQSGKHMSQGLCGVREVAKVRKQERFTALLHHVSVDLLRDSFFALKRRAAPGVDGMTWREYETGLEGRLIDLHNRVHRRAYRAQPSRRVYIPKADGRQRPLGIAALEDKIVQQAVVTILNQIYKADFKGFLTDSVRDETRIRRSMRCMWG